MKTKTDGATTVFDDTEVAGGTARITTLITAFSSIVPRHNCYLFTWSSFVVFATSVRERIAGIRTVDHKFASPIKGGARWWSSSPVA